jgi:hypothetical protein
LRACLSEIDKEIIEERFYVCHAVLMSMNATDLELDHPNNNLQDDDKQNKYNLMSQSETPPILVEGCKVIDGGHRVRTALFKKVKTIDAYLIIED